MIKVYTTPHKTTMQRVSLCSTALLALLMAAASCDAAGSRRQLTQDTHCSSRIANWCVFR